MKFAYFLKSLILLTMMANVFFQDSIAAEATMEQAMMKFLEALTKKDEKVAPSIEEKRDLSEPELTQDNIEKHEKPYIFPEKENVGRQVTAQIRLLSFSNIKANPFGILKSGEQNNRNQMTSFERLEWAFSHAYSKNKINKEKITTNVSIIEPGRSYKVVDFIGLEKEKESSYYIVADEEKNQYEVNIKEFSPMFENKSIIKEEGANQKTLLLALKEYNISKKEIKATYCSEIRDHAEKNPPTFNLEKFISDAEIDDPKFLELVEDTKTVNIKTFNTLLGNNQFSLDTPLLNISQYSKSLCYGVKIKNTKSMLNLYYFVSSMNGGIWKW